MLVAPDQWSVRDAEPRRFAGSRVSEITTDPIVTP